MFFRAFFEVPEGVLNVDLIQVGVEFDSYLKSKNLAKYDEVVSIEPKDVFARMSNPLFGLSKGYHPDLLLHFEEFVKISREELAKQQNPTV